MPSLNTHIAHRCNTKPKRENADMELAVWQFLCWFIPALFLVAITIDFVKWYGL